MILTCPACANRYLIDAAALGGGGRAVRCAGCGHRWFAAPPDDAPQSAAAEPPPVARPRRPPTASPPAARSDEPGRTGRLIGWLALALAVLLVAGAVVGRNEIVAGFPETAAIYRDLGLPVTIPLGLEFRDVTSTRLEEGGVAVLVVEGEIVNVTGQRRVVPPVRVALLDEGRRELEHELVPAGEGALTGGSATRFVARLVNPPVQARNFAVTFAAAGG